MRVKWKFGIFPFPLQFVLRKVLWIQSSNCFYCWNVSCNPMTTSKFILTIAFLAACFTNLFGQTEYGSLVLVIKQDNKKLWYHSQLISSDTTIDIYQNHNKRKVLHDSLPTGNYTLILFSELGDKISHNIFITAKTKLVINVKSYYSVDTSSTTFIDKISNLDTLKIYIRENGCFHGLDANCEINKQDTTFFINFQTQTGRLVYSLKNVDIETIENIERAGRVQVRFKTNPPYVSTTHTQYYFSLNNKLLTFGVHRPNFISELYYKYSKTGIEQRK